VLGAWVVRFLAYTALIVSAAIVLVLADVTSVWAILLVIGAVWLLGAGLEWLIWRREQEGWGPYDVNRWSSRGPARAPRRRRPSLRLPKLSLRRAEPPAEAVVEPPGPGTDAPAPPAEPEPMPPPADPEPAPEPPEAPPAPEPEPPQPEPTPPEPVPEPEEPEPPAPEPDPVPEPEPPDPEVEPAPAGRAETAPTPKRKSRSSAKPRRSAPKRAKPDPEMPADFDAAEPAGVEPEPPASGSDTPQAAIDLAEREAAAVRNGDGSPHPEPVVVPVAASPVPEPVVRPRPRIVPQPPRPPAVVTLPQRAPVAPTVVSLDERRRDEPREWNVWELERVARDESRRSPERADELSFLLVNLRQFAEPGGQLPAEFDGLVRESFGGVLDEPYGA
jgi:hypothetical protein